jgi:predicted SnoaL-like aldol condensation-catalyzing enzyme
MEHKSNKTIILELYKYVVGERNSALIDTYVSEHYIQHSPSLKTGKAGLLEAIELLKQFPVPKERKSPIIHAIEDGDYVMVHLDFEFMGTRKNVIDIFRLHHGKVAEHWDAVQDLSEEETVGIPWYKPGVTFKNVELTDHNKSLVYRFFHASSDQRNQFLSIDYVEHHAEVTKTAGRLGTYFERSIRDTTKVHRILGENNFVVVQSEGIKSFKRFVFYDLFNVLDNSIVEHWGVEQQIPDVMPHTNGMI